MQDLKPVAPGSDEDDSTSEEEPLMTTRGILSLLVDLIGFYKPFQLIFYHITAVSSCSFELSRRTCKGSVLNDALVCMHA